MKKKFGLGFLVFGLTASLIACSDQEESESIGEGTPEEPPTEEVTEANGSALHTGDIPDVVATVNGEEIDKDTYVSLLEQEANMYASQGMDLAAEGADELLDMIKQDVIDKIINSHILFQRVAKEGIEATDAEIEEELARQMKLAQIESEEQLEKALSGQNFTVEQLRQELAKEIKVDKFINQHMDQPTVTEDELQVAYDELVAMNENDEEVKFPSFEEYKEQLEEQLQRQKKQEQVRKFIEELRANSEITINL